MQLAVLVMHRFCRDKAEKRRKDSLGCNFDAPPANGSSKHNTISVYQVDATTHQGIYRTHEQATYMFSSWWFAAKPVKLIL
jgi:hypothetical protein